MKVGLFKTEKGLAVSLITAVLMFLAAAAYAETDVTSMVKVTYSNAVYDRVRKTTSYDVTLTNTSSETVFAPLIGVIESISPSTVTVANPDGMTADIKPYFNHNSSPGEERLDAGEISQTKKWCFFNPARVRFSFITRVTAIVQAPTPDLISLTNKVVEALNADSEAAFRDLTIGEQPLQLLQKMSPDEKATLAGTLQQYGIMLPSGADTTADELAGLICLEDPDEGLICSQVLLRKDSNGNWKIAEW